MRNATLAAAFVLLGAVTAAAQQPTALIAGSAFESTTGLPVPNAQVHFLGTEYAAQTDSAGAFRLFVPPGRYLLRARRLGFEPRSWVTEVPADTVTLALEMHISPMQLAEVVVEARESKYARKLAGFAERMRTSGAPASSFMTREEIEKRRPALLSEFLQSRGARTEACARNGLIFVDGLMITPDAIGNPTTGRRTEPQRRAQIPSQFNLTAPNGRSPECVIALWTR